MISRSSSSDLARLFPEVKEEAVALAYCGPAEIFTPATPEEVAAARLTFGLPQRYVLMVGDRTGSGAGGYKNGILAFRGVAEAAKRSQRFGIVCIGGLAEIEPDFRAAARGIDIVRLKPDDASLRLIFAGAHALIYPSRYEGFGMPVLEAMACGCPVITCPNSSLVEVGGDAAIFVNPGDANAMAEAIVSLADPTTRAVHVKAGLAQAAGFTTKAQAEVVMSAFRATIGQIEAGALPRPGSGWREFRRYQADIQADRQSLEALASLASAASNSALVFSGVHSLKNKTIRRLRGLLSRAFRRVGLRQRC